MATLAFLLLIAALVLFIVSTNQWTIMVRGAVWGAGVLALLIGWLALGQTQRDPELAAALGDFVAKLTHPGDSMLLKMFHSNSGSVARIILSLFDIFVVIAAIVAVVALVAFRPGERLEQALRPVMMGLIGAVFGGVFALAIVGTGFGENKERQSYAGPARLDTVFNGGTVLLNDTLLQLRGVSVPEEGQICRRGANVLDCGVEAKNGLKRIIEGAFLMCAPENTGAPKTPGAQSSRVVTCTGVRGGGEEFNVARRLVEEGYAFDVAGAYREEASRASALGRGLNAFCAVRPDVWSRMAQKDRAAFRDTGVLPKDTAVTGLCPPPKPQPGARRQKAVDAPVAMPK